MEKKTNDFNQAKKNSWALMDYSKITEPVKLLGKISPEEYAVKSQFHKGQAAYYESLNEKEKSDPTVPYRLKVTNEFTEVVRQRKEKLIQQLKEKQAELKEENLRQIRQRAQERDDRQKEEKLYKPINLDGVKRNSRAFETLKKAMKVFQVKFKDGPL